MENKMYDRVVGTEDRNEALAAFREKRKPEFQGR
jgi:methylglutaconyl-CoA hydratase